MNSTRMTPTFLSAIMHGEVTLEHVDGTVGWARVKSIRLNSTGKKEMKIAYRDAEDREIATMYCADVMQPGSSLMMDCCEGFEVRIKVTLKDTQ